MSRKGKLPITVPKNVEVKLSATEISVKGPKGTLHQNFLEGIRAQQEGDQLTVFIVEGHEGIGNFHGLYRSLIHNLIIGVTEGFEKKLEMIGVGYRAALQGRSLDLQLGFSHPTKLTIPEGIQVAVEKSTQISIKGANKQEVGQFAATVRAQRPPEVYQGKGIRYAGEYVRKKAGKAAASKK